MMSRSTGSSHRSNTTTTTPFVVVIASTAAVALSTAAGYYYYYTYYDSHKKPRPSWTNTDTEKTTDQVRHDNNETMSDDVPPPMKSIDLMHPGVGDTGTAPGTRRSSHGSPHRILSHHTITIVHGSMTGTCAKFAVQLYNDIRERLQQQSSLSSPLTTAALRHNQSIHVQMGCIEDFDWWDELINEDEDEENDMPNGNGTKLTDTATTAASSSSTLILLLPTYTNGTFTPNSMNLQEALEEIQTDWRISKQPLLEKLQVAVFGSGSSEYNDHDDTMTTPTTTSSSNKNSTITTNNMGQPAKIATRAFHKLGAKVITKLMIGDDAIGDHMETTFQQWTAHVLQALFTASSRKYKMQQIQLLRPNKQFSTLPNTTTATTTTTTATVTAPTTTSHKERTTNASSCGCHTSNNNETCCQNETPTDTTTTATTTSKSCCSTQETDHEQSNGCCQTSTQETDHEQSNGCCQTGSHNTSTVPQTSATATIPPAGEVDHNEDDDENYDYFSDGDDDDDDDDDDDEDQNGTTEPQVMDLEDIGDAIHQAASETKSNEPREMVTPSQAVALKKEGYKLIGTHSAVKLCRWTKHQLRGRGGCYKHTFYGITSYQCMEATPSLACANKCVFCWRHHKNPVGKEWRWKTDDPYYIVDEAVQTHIHMIKETRGIPGVQLDRWKEAHTVRHCALSLVGEPIMYPRIDELLGELHRRHISTFLVTNGQHPTAIGSIRPITQLYVSVDAPTEQSLIAIDRPLFQDAWDRLRLSLSSLKDKGQRTVARLTVVKGWNSDEISGYAELIALGQVSLVEVKGVTFCGKSDASNLNMTNTPWHHEVVELTRTLKDELNQMRQLDPNIPEYDLACEHKHSCSVLLARVDQFATEGYDTSTGQRKWRTWIDYDKFHALAVQHQEDPTCTFSVVDYTAPTPDWAIFGAKEEGFDPTDRRHRKQTKQPKYTQYDNEGIPTHDDNDEELSESERQRLRSMMEQRKRQIGDGSTVTTLRGGEKQVLDASLMFRGLVVAK